MSGSYSYLLSDEGSLHVVDIADPARPSIVGSDDTLEYGLRDLAVSGGHAYVVGTIAGLEVVDITNPATPLRVGGLEVPGEAWGVAVSGSFAYVAARGGGLHVVDITDPFNPQIVGALPALDDARKVVVVGAYAYVAGGYQGFHVIDITDPTTPQLVAAAGTTRTAVSVAISGNYAYVVENGYPTLTNILKVIDISDPGVPEVVGVGIMPGRSSDVAVLGNAAYLASTNLGLQAVDITDPTSPEPMGGVDMDGTGWGIAISGTLAFVAQGLFDLQVFDITGQEPVQLVGQVEVPEIDGPVVVAGSYAFALDDDLGGQSRLFSIDISDPVSPEVVGVADSLGSSVVDVAVAGNYAYIASNGSVDLQIVDISDPLNLERVGSLVTPGVINSVAVSGNYAYLGGGRCVVDVSDPMNPQLVALPVLGVDGFATAVSEDYLLASGNGEGGKTVYVIDISDPVDPQVLGSPGGLPYPATAEAIEISGNFAYVAAGTGGFLVIDFSNPSQPQLVAELETGEIAAYDVDLSRSHAYVANWTGGLRVIDISNPTNPMVVGGFDPELTMSGVAVADNCVVTTAYSKLMTLELQCESTAGVTPGEAGATMHHSKAVFLEQNFPNPCSPKTSFAFSLPHAGHVSLKVYDVRGSHVATLIDGLFPAGRSKAEWWGLDGHGIAVPAGVYFARLATQDETRAVKLTLTR
ncbi:MAG: hypothetical protein KDA27_15475 [Candidatus Eisenbacteria bacterium]|uniref:T9SS type A sorting domain-containing protein n=1 Tax=Eiseniibacteriota bacterium TaxID=2212470 RepID=A0A956SE61_UNCEI|nr:hypothetical protein [Candidatus Eisenbacteria bacterium]MCB9464464.1 hypothetical protein [Candidatus Eisenbacteria bacterium]